MGNVEENEEKMEKRRMKIRKNGEKNKKEGGK